MLAIRRVSLYFFPALAAIHFVFVIVGFSLVSHHFHPDKVVQQIENNGNGKPENYPLFRIIMISIYKDERQPKGITEDGYLVLFHADDLKFMTTISAIRGIALDGFPTIFTIHPAGISWR